MGNIKDLFRLSIGIFYKTDEWHDLFLNKIKQSYDNIGVTCTSKTHNYKLHLGETVVEFICVDEMEKLKGKYSFSRIFVDPSIEAVYYMSEIKPLLKSFYTSPIAIEFDEEGYISRMIKNI